MGIRHSRGRLTCGLDTIVLLALFKCNNSVDSPVLLPEECGETKVAYAAGNLNYNENVYSKVNVTIGG